MTKLIFKILFLLLVAASVSADSSNNSLIVVTEVLRPYQYQDNQGQLKGYSAEVVKTLLKELGSSADINVYPWSRSFKLASTQENVLIFSISRTKPREDNFIWIGKLLDEKHYFYALKTRNISANTISELSNYEIVINKDSPNDQYLSQFEFLKLQRTTSPEQVAKMIYSGRGDILFGPDSVVEELLPLLGYDFTQLAKVLDKPVLEVGLYIAMNKDSDVELVQQVKRTFSRMLEEGVIQQIKEKWAIPQS